MATLTEELVHYNKLSIANWQGLQERYRINQSMRCTHVDKMMQFTWHFTRELNEMWNSVETSDDHDWEGFQWADQQWRTIRSQLKQRVVLWVAKATHGKRYVPGKKQKTVRVPRTVSVLVWIPQEHKLIQMLKMEQWQRDFEFYQVDQPRYNMISTWMNPLTSLQGGVAPGGW